MNEIEGMITELVRTYKIIEDAEVLMHPVLEEIGVCPCCGRHVVERQKGYSCENRQCNFVLWKQNRFFEALGKKMTILTFFFPVIFRICALCTASHDPFLNLSPSLFPDVLCLCSEYCVCTGKFHIHFISHCRISKCR